MTATSEKPAAWAVPWEAWTPTGTSTVTSRGLALEVCDWGDVRAAADVILCAHGYLDSARFFGGLAALLVASVPGCAVRAFSFAGHGRSDRATAYAWSDHTADLLTVLSTLRSEVPSARITLLGHSFGGVHVVHVAERHPEAVDLVVDLDAVARPFAPTSRPPSGVVAARAERWREALPTQASVEDLAARRTSANPRIDPLLLRRLVELIAVVGVDGRWSWCIDPELVGCVRPWDAAPGAPGDPVPSLLRLSQPRLVVTGAAEDHPTIRGASPGDEVFADVPGLTHVALPDAGHYVHLERPLAVAAAVAALLAGER